VAMFQEVFASSGVDERASPTGIVVPLGPGKFNIVRLTGGTGLRLDHPKTITHEEISGSVLFTWASMLSGVALPFTLQPDTRYFKISGAVPGLVDLNAVGRRGVEAKLRVAVLKPRPVNVSIRPIQTLDPQSGNLVFHSKKPFDVDAMVQHMNDIWTPQANVVFKLTSSTPVPLTDQARIAKAYKFTDTHPLPDRVVLTYVRDMLNENRDLNAAVTLFLVAQAAGKDIRDVNEGITDSVFPISLISDGRTTIHELLAHEAGHLIGRRFNNGTDFPDLDPDMAANKNKLMNFGGSEAAKISFDDAVKHFNQPGASYDPTVP
jgi:hypothetical protein